MPEDRQACRFLESLTKRRSVWRRLGDIREQQITCMQLNRLLWNRTMLVIADNSVSTFQHPSYVLRRFVSKRPLVVLCFSGHQLLPYPNRNVINHVLRLRGSRNVWPIQCWYLHVRHCCNAGLKPVVPGLPKQVMIYFTSNPVQDERNLHFQCTMRLTVTNNKP